MTTYTITGDDTLTLYDRVITDFADEDNSAITYNNDLVTVKTGKNQNTIYSRDESGNNAVLSIRLIKGSSDDRFLQNKLVEIQGDFASVTLATGAFVKRLGDGSGAVVSEVSTLLGGVITRKIDTKGNANGDTTQGVSIYSVTFANAKRSMQ